MKIPTPRSLALGLVLAATAATGTAIAAQAMHGDKTMTRSEVQAHSTEMFARLDVNKDGKLDPADREARRNAMFDRLDTDKNGQLSRAEFSTRPARPDHMAGGPMGPGHMAKHGPAGEGGHGGMMHHRHGKRGGMMMMARMADADKDGAISQAEFTASALKHFDRMDANKDGQVTKEERQAARQSMREAWKARQGGHDHAAPPAQ